MRLIYLLKKILAKWIYFWRNDKLSNYTNLLNNLEELKLDKFRTYLPNYLEEINENQINFIDALLNLTEKEIEFRNERASKIQVSVSAFPFEKTLKDFDFDFQPSVNKTKLQDLETLRFLDNGERKHTFLWKFWSWKNTFSCWIRNSGS